VKRTSIFARASVLIGITAAVGACSTAASSSNGSNEAAGVKTVTIGLVDSLTGSAAAAGVEQQLAMQLAIKEIDSNPASKVKFSLIVKDDQTNPAQAVSAMQSLLADNSVVAVTGFVESEDGAATIPLLAKDGRPALFLQVTTLPNRPPNVFSLGPPQVGTSTKVASYAYGKASGKRVALISQVQPTLTAAADAFKSAATSAGMTMVSNQQVALTATSFDPQITNALSDNPDAIGLAMTPPNAGLVVSQLRSSGYKGVIFASSVADNATTIKTAGSAINGVYVCPFWDPAVSQSSAVSKAFVQDYEAAYPKELPPDFAGMQAYDAVHILSQAIASVGTDKATLTKYLASTSFTNVGAQTTLRFNSDGFADLSGYIVSLSSSGQNELMH
jgi:branched-chain amino acid transport system substrate-binding protein